MKPRLPVAATQAFFWALCMCPAAWLLARAFGDDLGPDPARELSLETGIWSLRLMIATLAVSPASRLFARPQWVRVRRVFGLSALAYVSLHLLVYAGLLLGWNFAELYSELVKRPYIVVGAAAWLLLLPLGATSNRAMRRRLGSNWKRLHRLAYVVACLGAVHFLWLSKTAGEPLIYAAILALLLGERLARFTFAKARPGAAR